MSTNREPAGLTPGRADLPPGRPGLTPGPADLPPGRPGLTPGPAGRPRPPVGGAPARPVGYAGFVTRAVAMIADAVVIDVIAIVAGAAVTLLVSLVHGDVHLSLGKAVLGGFAWVLWTGAYFVTFWTLTGQTPGNRLLGIRVSATGGETIGIAKGVRRFVGLVIAMIPLGAGFLPVLVDDRRRGLHDRIAGTVVRWVEGVPDELPS